MLAALDRPEAFAAAHVLLSRHFDLPSLSYADGSKRWNWTDDTGDIARLRPREGPADRPPPGPVRGHYRGLRIELRPPPDNEMNFSGGMAFPCQATIDPAQLPAIRDAWHRRLDVVVLSIPHAALAAAMLVLPAIWRAAALRSVVRARTFARRCLCPTCGYDLRATPDRCPECGVVSAAK